MLTADLFKRKVSELLSKLQDRFPGRLMFAGVALQAADPEFMLKEYVDRVHRPYGDKIRHKDENFFLTVEGLDDPLNMVGLLRGLWGELDAPDKEVVWRYLSVFEKMASKSVS